MILKSELILFKDTFLFKGILQAGTFFHDKILPYKRFKNNPIQLKNMKKNGKNS